MRRIFQYFFFLIIVFILPGQVQANWTMNAGYHNPVGSTYGLNLLYWGQNLGFEFGVGWIDLEADIDEENEDDGDDEDNDDSASIRVGGDLDLKYFFTKSSFRPYIQGGFGWGSSGVLGKSDGGGAGLGGPFAGLGAFIGKPAFHGYGSVIINKNIDLGVQAGLGFDI